MSVRMEIIAAKKYEQNGEQKTFWMKLGSAFQNQDGVGWTIVLDTVPVGPGWDGKMQMRPPREQGDSRSNQQQRSNNQRSNNNDRGGF